MENNRSPLLVPEQIILQIMERVLHDMDIPSEQYHLDGYAEECVCLERTDNGWEVYDGERGKRYTVFASPDLYQACLEMLDRLAESEERSAFVQRYFQYALHLQEQEEKRSLTRAASQPPRQTFRF